jgi:hypothetical protein
LLRFIVALSGEVPVLLAASLSARRARPPMFDLNEDSSEVDSDTDVVAPPVEPAPPAVLLPPAGLPPQAAPPAAPEAILPTAAPTAVLPPPMLVPVAPAVLPPSQSPPTPLPAPQTTPPPLECAPSHWPRVRAVVPDDHVAGKPLIVSYAGCRFLVPVPAKATRGSVLVIALGPDSFLRPNPTLRPPLVCAHCGVPGLLGANLSIHEKACAAKSVQERQIWPWRRTEGYPCTVAGCGKVYRNRDSLCRHMRSKHPEVARFLPAAKARGHLPQPKQAPATPPPLPTPPSTQIAPPPSPQLECAPSHWPRVRAVVPDDHVAGKPLIVSYAGCRFLVPVPANATRGSVLVIVLPSGRVTDPVFAPPPTQQQAPPPPLPPPQPTPSPIAPPAPEPLASVRAPRARENEPDCSAGAECVTAAQSATKRRRTEGGRIQLLGSSDDESDESDDESDGAGGSKGGAAIGPVGCLHTSDTGVVSGPSAATLSEAVERVARRVSMALSSSSSEAEEEAEGAEVEEEAEESADEGELTIDSCSDEDE